MRRRLDSLRPLGPRAVFWRPHEPTVSLCLCVEMRRGNCVVGPVDWCQVLLNTLGLASTTAVTPHGTYHAFDSRPAQGPGLADRPLLILHGMFTAASSMVCVRVCKCDLKVCV
jgi:hypothetical protein